MRMSAPQNAAIHPFHAYGTAMNGIRQRTTAIVMSVFRCVCMETVYRRDWTSQKLPRVYCGARSTHAGGSSCTNKETAMRARGSPDRYKFGMALKKRGKMPVKKHPKAPVKKSHRARQRGDTGVGWQGKINIGRQRGRVRTDNRFGGMIGGRQRVVVNKVDNY